VALRATTTYVIWLIATVMAAPNLSLADARCLMETSPAFNLQRSVHTELRRELLDRIAHRTKAVRESLDHDPDYARNDLDGTDDQGMQSPS
jgi:hypothetical protein